MPQQLLSLKTPEGDDVIPVQGGTLHAIEVRASERLSAPFEVVVTAVSEVQGIDPDELLYKPVSLTVHPYDTTSKLYDRQFNGLVRRFETMAQNETLGHDQELRWYYRLTVVPRLWFLDQNVDCRIFQKKTAEEILGTVFDEHNVKDVEFELFGANRQRPYTTQFNESDLVFVQRIMQESGYFYFFKHEDGKDKLVVANYNRPFPEKAEPRHVVDYGARRNHAFQSWTESLQTAYGHIKIEDYDPEKPKDLVSGQRTTRLTASGHESRDVYRWPAMSVDRGVVDDRARFRMEAAEAHAALRSGQSIDPRICPGFRFTLEDPVSEQDVEHVVYSAEHHARDETWRMGGDTTPPECSFECFKKDVKWRDDLTIPRPVMPGIFSGVVLGNDGEEIHTDKLGRIKVQPKFDHRQETTADKSIFMRVLHAWAGGDKKGSWGWQHLPRVGSEVGIAFMNGDPDNPVCVGCFYHEDHKPVFDLPDEETKQGFRSRSSKDGDKDDFNELSFDDKKGSEQVLLHAKKDLKVEVENDRTVETKGNDSLTSEKGEITIDAKIGPITISSTTELTLQVDEVMIMLTPAGIQVVAPEITFATELFFAPPPIPTPPQEDVALEELAAEKMAEEKLHGTDLP